MAWCFLNHVCLGTCAVGCAAAVLCYYLNDELHASDPRLLTHQQWAIEEDPGAQGHLSFKVFRCKAIIQKDQLRTNLLSMTVCDRPSDLAGCDERGASGCETIRLLLPAIIYVGR